MVAHNLAQSAGISVPPARMLQLGNGHRTFCVKRFDRHNGRRVFYASARTMLSRTDSHGASYLDLAQFIMSNGAHTFIKDDLAQLFRRVIFNIAIGNRDDHLRNHGFVLTETGWRLSRAFDVNPNHEKADHVLNIDDRDNRPLIENALATAEYYELTNDQAVKIASEVTAVIKSWKDVGKQYNIPRADINLMEGVFLSRHVE
ncbi:type II toxin-antitoxin system HipA family toxin [Acidiferrobacter sp.]|uniref:type II toxin-antitoxin system HipA family toxin n=1 Tax=Acidiferrobacter sp. TaxID=1872107 RepID=UPI002611BC75|nr:HipA domain-containing protein [Acidiferrobacter sp.]